MILDAPETYKYRASEISKVLEESKEQVIRIAVESVLGSMGNENQVATEELITAVVSDNHHLVRLESARALRAAHELDNSPSESTIIAMSRALSDEEDEVALEAMSFMFDHPSREATKPLLGYIERPEA